MTCLIKTAVSLYRDRRAVSAIEAAIALPVLLMILLGLFDFSMAMRYQVAYNDAVAVGARYATLSPTPTVDEVRARVLNSSSVPMTNATVTVVSGTSASGRTYYDVSLAAIYTVSIPFVAVPPIALTSSKRAYVG